MTDLDSIVDHNVAMAFETEGRRLDPERALSGAEAILKDPSKGFYLIVEIDHINIGQCMITFEWSDWRCGNFWWIQSVFIDSEYRRLGIFSLLFHHILDKARSDGNVVGLRLYVEKDNSTAQEAYAQLGMIRCHYDMFELDFTSEEIPFRQQANESIRE